MCHLQTHPNSTWGSTVEGKGGPSPVSKKIAQKRSFPGELPAATKNSGKILGVTCTVAEEMLSSTHNLVAGQIHKDTYDPKYRGLVCQPLAGFEANEKVPPDPLQTVITTLLIFNSVCYRGSRSELTKNNQVLINNRVSVQDFTTAISVSRLGFH